MKKTYKIEVDCANCANLMEDAARKTAGVASATVNFMTQQMIVEFEEGKDAKQVMKEVLKACRKVEPDCEIEIQLEAVFYGAPDAESGRGADLKYIIQQISKY